MSDVLQLSPLGELVALQTEKIVANKDPRLPYVGLEHIEQGSPKLLGVAESTASSSTNSVFAQDDILFGKLRPNLRKSIRAPFAGYCSTDILVLRCLDGVAPAFAGHVFQWEDVFAAASATAAGTKMPRMSWDDLKRFQVFRPSTTAEQSRIAAVLDTVDEAIAKTEAVIAKLKQVRTGLLHDLLTRGLDEHGQLRDPIAHPEQFQDSLLGWIPINWSVKELKDCYAVPSRNGLYKKATYYGSGHRMIHMPQMFKDITVDVADAVRVAVEAEELQRYSLDPGDLLFARRSLNLEGAGLCSIVPALDEPVTFESSIVRVRLDQNIILPGFAVEFLRSELGYLLRRPFIRQVAVSGVSSEDIGHFLVPCPKPDEQGRILTVLDSYDHGLRLYEAELRKLVHLKSGLMTDLLTGRVRVPEGVAVAP
jgi:type I restriction enzyme S subunit